MSENTSAEASSEAIDKVRRLAGETLGVPMGQVALGDPVKLPPSDCSIVAAWDPESTNPYPSQWATLFDGTIMAGGTTTALEQTIASCFVDQGFTPEASTLADVVVLLGKKSGPIVLLQSGSATRALEAAGYEVTQPETTEGDNGTTLTFLVENRETGSVGRMICLIAPDGSITTSYEELARTG